MFSQACVCSWGWRGMPGLRFLPRGGGWVCQAGDTYPTGMLSCYRPQRSWGKVIFSQASVILLTGGYASFRGVLPRGGVLPPGAGGASSGGGGCFLRVGALPPGGVMLPPRGCFLLWGALLRGGPGGDPPGRLLLRAARILLECILVNFVGNHEYTTDRFLKMNCNFLHFIFDKSVQKISLQYICSYKILQGFQILS